MAGRKPRGCVGDEEEDGRCWLRSLASLARAQLERRLPLCLAQCQSRVRLSSATHPAVAAVAAVAVRTAHRRVSHTLFSPHRSTHTSAPGNTTRRDPHSSIPVFPSSEFQSVRSPSHTKRVSLLILRHRGASSSIPMELNERKWCIFGPALSSKNSHDPGIHELQKSGQQASRNLRIASQTTDTNLNLRLA
jgi:hypothetical protein